jgi:hypothetical protein
LEVCIPLRDQWMFMWWSGIVSSTSTTTSLGRVAQQ